MTRKNYLLVSAAAAGAYLAWRRWGAGRNGEGLNTSSMDDSSSRGETIFSNTPTISSTDVSHLGAAEGL